MKIVINYINLSESTPLSFRHAYVTRSRTYRHLWRHNILTEHDSHLFKRHICMGLVSSRPFKVIYYLPTALMALCIKQD